MKIENCDVGNAFSLNKNDTVFFTLLTNSDSFILRQTIMTLLHLNHITVLLQKSVVDCWNELYVGALDLQPLYI